MLSAADLEGVRAREPAALGRFFDEHFDRVYGLLYRLTSDRATAEDLTQETFLKIHRASSSLDPSRDPWPWVATIATNVCRDHWGAASSRLQARSDSIDGEPARTDLRDGGANPEEATRAAQEAALLQEALRKLAEPARLLVLLHDWLGLRHDEIARITGQSHAAVRQQYARALTLLRGLLGNLRP